MRYQESLVSGESNILRNLLPRLLAAVLLFSIAAASSVWAAHQVQADLHGLGSTDEVTASYASDPAPVDGAVLTDSALCISGVQCHAQMVLPETTGDADPWEVVAGAKRPEAGSSLQGFIVKVITPPPLTTRI
jgi:hypothetical protein